MIQVFPTVFPPQNTPAVDSNGAVTNAFMAFFRDLYNRTGAGSGLVNQVSTLTTPANAAVMSDWVLVTGGASSITLPALTNGQGAIVQNNSVAPMTINAPPGATIDGGPSYSLPNTKMQIFWFFSSTQIFSTQLG